MIIRLMALALGLGAGFFAFADTLNGTFLTASEEFVTGIGSSLSDAVYKAAQWITRIIGV